MRLLSRYLPGLAACLLLCAGQVQADPCGMVPPVRLDPDEPALTRIDVQKTFVFYGDGIEDFIVRPAFRGRVAEFGMLIPCPEPPSLRKVPDDIFDQIARAVDPPIVELYPPAPTEEAESGGGGVDRGLGVNEVKVLREEAVGMYQVAVLEAGSAKALERWMTDNGYIYPTGMDAACNDYVKDGWCFVAVKTQVAPKKQVDPQPGMETPEPKLPEGASFDGAVQAMGFRFRTERLVVPMRLSAFNAGKLDNKIWILADEGLRCEQLPKSMVRRQLDGATLHGNMTNPLPIRTHGRPIEELEKTAYWKRQLAKMRDPSGRNGKAKLLFADDLLALRENRLVHPHEKREKELLRIGEALGLRGPELDVMHARTLETEREKAQKDVLQRLEEMTLTIIEGEFPREILAAENLTFAPYDLPEENDKEKDK